VKQARAKAKAQAKEDAAVEEWLSDEDEMVF
jgi:hypothetical protein